MSQGVFLWLAAEQRFDETSEVILIDQLNEDLWRTGGALSFGPDGFLYITVGDEDSMNDQFLNSQEITQDLYSGILRIDVNQTGGEVSHPIRNQPQTGTTSGYFIPSDNPWVGVDGALEEFYAIGLRSPHNLFGVSKESPFCNGCWK